MDGEGGLRTKRALLTLGGRIWTFGGFEGRPGLASIVLAAIAYNSILSVANYIADIGYSATELFLYLFAGTILSSSLSIVLSLLLDVRLRVVGRVSWQVVLLLSFAFAAIDIPLFWFMLGPAERLQVGLSSFLSGGIVSDATTYAVWAILHLCIRSAERAIAQERRTAALREAMLRYENEALSCALDSGFFIDALTRIARALKNEAGVLAGEIVMSLAGRMRASLAPRDPPPEEVNTEAFAGSAERVERSEMADASLRRLLLIGTLGVWAGFFCSFASMEIVGGRLWWKSVSDYGGQAIVGILWFVFAGKLLRKMGTYRIHLFYFAVLVACIFGIVACSVWLLLSFMSRGDLTWPPLTRWIVGFELGRVAPIFIGWAAIHFLIDARRREIARLNAAAEIREAALKARNAVLRLQVSPHFLFNALNALYALILDRQFERARGMITAVRRFVDRASDPASGELVELSSELATQDAYLEIERMRFGDRLRVERHIDAEVAGAKVPHLILQPLVENAVKYAVGRTDRPVAIEIRARRAGLELVLEVVDTGAPEATPWPPGLGMGLRNVEARLKSLYGGAGRLACRPLEPAGFLAEVWLPLSL